MSLVDVNQTKRVELYFLYTEKILFVLLQGYENKYKCSNVGYALHKVHKRG